jgi:hypothetical protein
MAVTSIGSVTFNVQLLNQLRPHVVILHAPVATAEAHNVPGKDSVVVVVPASVEMQTIPLEEQMTEREEDHHNDHQRAPPRPPRPDHEHHYVAVVATDEPEADKTRI